MQMRIIPPCWSLEVALPSATDMWQMFPEREELNKMRKTFNQIISELSQLRSFSNCTGN